jgi:hypothetical protein
MSKSFFRVPCCNSKVESAWGTTTTTTTTKKKKKKGRRAPLRYAWGNREIPQDKNEDTHSTMFIEGQTWRKTHGRTAKAQDMQA